MGQNRLSLIVMVLTCLAIANCSTSSNVNHYKERFYEHQQDFEKLIVILKRDTGMARQIGRSFSAQDMSSEIQKKLNDLGIVTIEFNNNHCPGKSHINLSTSWTSKGSVSLVKDVCDKEQTKKGYHGKAASGTIDIWGLGDGWLLWIDDDFI